MCSQRSPATAERAVASLRGRAVHGYVAAARGARRLARRAGVLPALDRRRHRPVPLFLRSLFSVHDIDDLVRLDLPWWTFGAIRKADGFLARLGWRARAFEWGAGASTLWLARRCTRVVSVEHDPDWWLVVRARADAAAGADVRLVPAAPAEAPRCASGRRGWGGLDFAAYVAAIEDASGPFDIIVIDGRARADCLDAARAHLAPGGLVVFDNSNRRRYQNAIRRSGLLAERIGGFAPSVPWPSETALLWSA